MSVFFFAFLFSTKKGCCCSGRCDSRPRTIFHSCGRSVVCADSSFFERRCKRKSSYSRFHETDFFAVRLWPQDDGLSHAIGRHCASQAKHQGLFLLLFCFFCAILLKRIEKRVEYLNSYDTTIMGSRNGQSPLFMWLTIKKKGIEGKFPTHSFFLF